MAGLVIVNAWAMSPRYWTLLVFASLYSAMMAGIGAYYAAVSFTSPTLVERKRENLPLDRETVIEAKIERCN